MNKNKKNKSWTKPKIKKLGNAKDIVANVNTVGGGDSTFSVLNPS
tara:strand:+ start:673 stop:807 length:135 start_codon:yes stop_codon:yes gene_type:complete